MVPALDVAVNLTATVRETRFVLTGNVALNLPAPITMVLDPMISATAGLLLESVTEIPPAGAGPVSVIVPVEFNVPCTRAGLKVSPPSPGDLTMIAAVF